MRFPFDRLQGCEAPRKRAAPRVDYSSHEVVGQAPPRASIIA
jgi:hypothetical protein